MAFSKMDKDGNGFIDPEDIIDTYDASKHPDVLAGKKSAEEVFREFLDTFDVGGEKDGKVTRNEFANYYSNVSSSIDDDDYFELMIRNAWHISGGEGWCANTSNRRVLVTHANGRQTVEEIKDDLGLKADDKAGMMRALKAQGVNANDIELYGGNEENGDGGKGDLKNSTALNPNEKQEQQYFHRKQGKAHENSFSIGGSGSETKSFKEVKDSECAGSSVSYQNLVNKQTGKKKVDQVHLFQSSVVFGDDGVNDKKGAAKKLHVSWLQASCICDVIKTTDCITITLFCREELKGRILLTHRHWVERQGDWLW